MRNYAGVSVLQVHAAEAQILTGESRRRLAAAGCGLGNGRWRVCWRGDTRIPGCVKRWGLRLDGHAGSDCGRARWSVDGAEVDVGPVGLLGGRSPIGYLARSARSADYDGRLPAMVAILHGGLWGVVLCAVHRRHFSMLCAVLDALCGSACVGADGLLRRHSCGGRRRSRSGGRGDCVGGAGGVERGV